MKYIRLYITKSICGGSIFMFFVGDPLPRINEKQILKEFSNWLSYKYLC